MPKRKFVFYAINNMVERVADTMAAPLAGIVRISEELARPIQGWQQLVSNIPSFRNFECSMEGLQPFLQEFRILVEDAEAGHEVLRASEFGFADHFWSIFYVRGFAHIDPRVRSEVVTTRLASYTKSEEFIAQLGIAVGESKLMHKRWRIIQSACEAHAARNYELSVPATLAQIEGILVNLMFLKDLVKKENGKFFLLQRLAVTLDHSALWAIAASFKELRGKTGHAAKRAVLQSKVSGPTSLQSALDENGDFKLTKNGKKRLPFVTLHPAITNAKLEEHPDLAAASEFVANTLVQRRNDVLHGHDLSSGKAKFSVQAMLILAVLTEAFQS